VLPPLLDPELLVLPPLLDPELLVLPPLLDPELLVLPPLLEPESEPPSFCDSAATEPPQPGAITERVIATALHPSAKPAILM